MAPIVFALGDSGVQPGTYGDAQTIPQITVNRQGQLTAVALINAVGAARTIPDGAVTTINDGSSLVVSTYYKVLGLGQLIIQGDGALVVL